MWVKVCGLTREKDLDTALDAGADAVGFILAPSTRRLTRERARSLAARVDGRALTVAVLTDPARLDGLGDFDAVQVHGHVPARPPGLRLLRALRPGDEPDIPADWYLVDGSRGRGVTGGWNELASRAWSAPVVLAGGLSPDNVQAAIAVASPFGVDVCSGVEATPGVKDAVLVRRFVESARSA